MPDICEVPVAAGTAPIRTAAAPRLTRDKRHINSVALFDWLMVALDVSRLSTRQNPLLQFRLPAYKGCEL